MQEVKTFDQARVQTVKDIEDKKHKMSGCLFCDVSFLIDFTMCDCGVCPVNNKYYKETYCDQADRYDAVLRICKSKKFTALCREYDEKYNLKGEIE